MGDNIDKSCECIIQFFGFCTCIFIIMFGLSIYFYEISCWKPHNNFLCPKEPLEGNIIEKIIDSTNCFGSTCYTGYVEVSYNKNNYCYIEIFNNIYSYDYASQLLNTTYYIGEQIYITLGSDYNCYEYEFDKNSIVISLTLMFLSIFMMILCGSFFCCLLTNQ